MQRSDSFVQSGCKNIRVRKYEFVAKKEYPIKIKILFKYHIIQSFLKDFKYSDIECTEYSDIECTEYSDIECTEYSDIECTE